MAKNKKRESQLGGQKTNKQASKWQSTFYFLG